MQWFRLHNKILNDPVVQGLTHHQFRVYINLLCHASARNDRGCVGSIDETAFVLRETIENVSSCFIAFQERGLLVTSETDSETFHIPQWSKKQYESDTSTDRVRRHREKKKRSKTVTVTAPDTDTDTEQIQKKNRGRFTPPSIDQVRAYCQERGNQVDPERFVDHYTSNGWQVGKNKMKDWKAAVRTWEKSTNENTRGNTQRPVNARRLSAAERVRAAAERRKAGSDESGQIVATVDSDG